MLKKTQNLSMNRKSLWLLLFSLLCQTYAYVRNPMITGIFLILTGEACLLGSYAIGIWTVLFLVINLIYFPLSEEPGLRARFGKEYDTYCKNVPRYIPRLTPWKRINQ